MNTDECMEGKKVFNSLYFFSSFEHISKLHLESRKKKYGFMKIKKVSSGRDEKEKYKSKSMREWDEQKILECQSPTNFANNHFALLVFSCLAYTIVCAAEVM